MKLNKLLLALAASGIATSAFATNGYFAHGIGVKAKAMGGASIAFAEDGFGAATNPAHISGVADGYSVGLSAFAPDRGVHSSSISQAYIGTNNERDGNGTSLFAIPELAYSKKHDDKVNLGIVVYGNGGMNVEYSGQVYDPTRQTTTNLEQLFIAPTVSYKINDKNAVAISANLVYQTFEATGLGMFTCYTTGGNCNTGAGASDPGNHGKDSSTGIGVRVGWLGKMTENVSLGAFYQTETKMEKFDKYNYLFAEQGGFNIPATYGLGLSALVNPKTSLALDVVNINYGDIRSLANRNNHTPGSTNLGDNDGKGFGWKDMTVYKLGLAHKLDEKTTVRAGWNYGKTPVQSSELDFNLLAPAVVEHHFTAGFTRDLGGKAEFSMHLMYAPKVTLVGTPSASSTDGTAHIDTLHMSQYEIGFQYSKKF